MQYAIEWSLRRDHPIFFGRPNMQEGVRVSDHTCLWVASSGMGSGHKTLLYGNAILLRHHNSGMYLACLSSSSSSDKLAFDVGLQEQSEGEFLILLFL